MKMQQSAVNIRHRPVCLTDMCSRGGREGVVQYWAVEPGHIDQLVRVLGSDF